MRDLKGALSRGIVPDVHDQFIVDAFERGPFTGNPAAIVPLDSWLPDELMQAIAGENNLSETAFFVANGDSYELRWFTPTHEVPLCGHATLASAHIIWDVLGSSADRLSFATKSGQLGVTKLPGLNTYELDFPEAPVGDHVDGAVALSVLGVEGEVFDSLGAAFVVCESATAVRECEPDFDELAKLGAGFAIVTARADFPLQAEGFDVVTRVFAPGVGIEEDPATGSAHCAVAPYWSREMGVSTIKSFQASKRGGYFECKVPGNGRVLIAGTCRTFSTGKLELDGSLTNR